MKVEISQTSETCNRIKGMGYAPWQENPHLREKFEVLSDPFAEDIGIGIRVKQDTRVLQLPSALLQPPKRKWAAYEVRVSEIV
jgi:hypothetical protein